jgi:hypothetical protein
VERDDRAAARSSQPGPQVAGANQHHQAAAAPDARPPARRGPARCPSASPAPRAHPRPAERPRTAPARILGTASLLVLLWEVASQLHLRASDTRVVLALAGGAALGWLLAIGVPSRRRTAIVLPTAMRDLAAAAAPGHLRHPVLVLVFGTVAVYAVRRR